MEIPPVYTSQQRPLPHPRLSSTIRQFASHYKMGVLEKVTEPLAQQVSERGTATVVASGFAAFIVLSVVINVLSQVLFKDPNEPPMVFHLFPVIGSTVTYGMDPYGFFFKCRAKVCCAQVKYSCGHC